MALAAAAAAAAVTATGAAGGASAANVPCGCSVEPLPVGEAAVAVNGFGARLQQAMAAADADGNLVVSPLSIEIALAMANAGAAGETRSQLDAALGITADDPAVVGGLLDVLLASGKGSLQVADSLWMQSGYDIEQNFLDVLSWAYRSEPHAVDFAADPDAARQDVNAWVADHTNDRIAELLSPGAVDALTRLILVNAIHLDADWQHPFEPEQTTTEPFTTAGGASVDVETMHQTSHFDYGSLTTAAGELQAVSLPYTDGYEMVVVLPPDGGLADFEQLLADAGGDLDAVLGGWSDAEVDLSLPTWDLETAASLPDVLRQLGIVDAFDPDAADFTGITTGEQLFIGDVVHQADITVDEAGTEAAAATATVMVAGAAPGEETHPVEMTVDHPFFYVIRDQATNAVIFQGRVTNPS